MGLGLSILFAVIAFFNYFNTVRRYCHTARRNRHQTPGGRRSMVYPRAVSGGVGYFYRRRVALTFGVIYLSFRWLDPYLSIVLRAVYP